MLKRRKKIYNKDKLTYTLIVLINFFAQLIRAYFDLVDFLSSFLVRIGDGDRDRLDESLFAFCGSIEENNVYLLRKVIRMKHTFFGFFIIIRFGFK
jgi:hypothetical protein